MISVYRDVICHLLYFLDLNPKPVSQNLLVGYKPKKFIPGLYQVYIRFISGLYQVYNGFMVGNT